VSGKGELQIPRLPPDFLSGLLVPVNLMRLSSKKAAYVAVAESGVVGNPEFARDDKLEGSAYLSSGKQGMDRAAAVYPQFSFSWVGRRPMTPPVGMTTQWDH
jgi:hypothetical protein